MKKGKIRIKIKKKRIINKTNTKHVKNLKINNVKKKNKYYIYIIFTKFISILIFLSIITRQILYYKNDLEFCINCSKNLDNNILPECWKCDNELLFKGLYVASREETVKEIIKKKKSISRFSDGEFSIIYGGNINFQKYDKTLSKRLKEIIKNNNKDKKLLVGIIFPYKEKILKTLVKSTQSFWKNFFDKNKFKLLKILDKNKKYYSGSITRFYINYKDKSQASEFIKKLKKIWEGRDIIIVEGDKSRIGIGNDLFNKTKSIKRIICPAKHAFSVYDRILNAVLKVSKDKLILIALGPTASVLACDLSKKGYQAIDIGHTDIQYELYLRNATKKVRIKYKFFNEYDGGRIVEDINDENYSNQIIEKIF